MVNIKTVLYAKILKAWYAIAFNIIISSPVYHRRILEISDAKPDKFAADKAPKVVKVNDIAIERDSSAAKADNHLCDLVTFGRKLIAHLYVQNLANWWEQWCDGSQEWWCTIVTVYRSYFDTLKVIEASNLETKKEGIKAIAARKQ